MSDVRVIEGDYRAAVLEAKEAFLELLQQYGLTVLPEFQSKWWKCE